MIFGRLLNHFIKTRKLYQQHFKHVMYYFQLVFLEYQRNETRQGSQTRWLHIVFLRNSHQIPQLRDRPGVGLLRVNKSMCYKMISSWGRWFLDPAKMMEIVSKTKKDNFWQPVRKPPVSPATMHSEAIPSFSCSVWERMKGLWVTALNLVTMSKNRIFPILESPG